MLIFAIVSVGTLAGLDALIGKNLPDTSTAMVQIAERTTLKNQQVTVPPEVLKKFVHKNGWLQILNEEGKEIYSYQKPAQIQKAYAPGELVSYRRAGKLLDYSISTWFKQVGTQNLTWVYGVKNTESVSVEETLFWMRMLAVILILFLTALFFAWQIGKPVWHLLKWIDHIADGNYQEPEPSGKEQKQHRKGFSGYEEVMQAMKKMSQSLQQNEMMRKQLETSREEWVAGISHDMKTPLSSVKGYAGLLETEQYSFSEEEVKTYAGIISEKASYMEDLIEDLNLTFAINNNALPLNLQESNIVELTRRSVIGMVNSGRADNAEFCFTCSDEKIIYPVDEKWFARALDNILSNAVYHNQSGIRITVTVTREPESDRFLYAPVKIRIADNGEGMTKEQTEHIFERYYRGKSTGEKNGSGLGTAIAKQLIEAIGGKITLESVLHKGTAFSIVFPGKN